jgi:hypothetical protein
VTRCIGVMTSAGGDVAKGGDDVSWADANLTGPKNEKIHVVDSASTNRR